MKYTGRIVSLLNAMIGSLGFNLYYYIVQGIVEWFHIVASVLYLSLGWGLGKQYDKVKYLSEKDILTQSYNRRFVMDSFPKLQSLSDRKGQKLIVFLIDIDDFKQINDKHDHAMGDRVLQLISDTLKHAFRESDYVVRWGGDEFLVLLPCADETGIHELQHRLDKELSKLSNTVLMDVSVSVGSAVYPDEGVSLDELIKIADGKMYSDKRSKS